jgi:hypothetical protein
MAHGLTLLAAATLTVGALQFLDYVKSRGKRRAQREALQTWEDEGGAVPVSRSTTAAQVGREPREVDPAIHR